MASPLLIFSLGMATVAGALGIGFGGSYFLMTSEPAKESKMGPKESKMGPVRHHEPPPPIVEKVEMREAPLVAEPEPVAVTEPKPQPETLPRKSRPDSAGWITEPLPEKPAATLPVPAIPFTQPVAPVASQPPPMTAPLPASVEPRAPVTAASRPAHLAENPLATTDAPAAAPAPKPKKKVARELREKAVPEESRKRVIVERWRERVVDDDDDRTATVYSSPPREDRGLFGILFR